MSEEAVNAHALSAVETADDAPQTLVGASANADGVICGILRYDRDEAGWYYFTAIGNGFVTVNFSVNGVITSRMGQQIFSGQIYSYDTKNNKSTLGFTCS